MLHLKGVFLWKLLTMKNDSENLAKIAKIALIMFILSVIVVLMCMAKNILIPIIIAFIFALLLLPVVRFLIKKWHFKDVLAAFVTVVLATSIVIGIVLIMSKQIAMLLNDFPEIKKNLGINLQQLQLWIRDTFNVSFDKQNDLFSKTVKSNKMMGGPSFKSLNSISGVLLNIFLTPIYTFLILIYRKNFVNFVHTISKKKNTAESNEIMASISVVIRQYMIGLCTEMAIVSLLTGFGLWIIGVKYFFFLAILTALLNLIPYIGILIAGSISILITLVGSTELSLILGVVLVNVVVQLIDNNILIPKVVGSKVSINALASIIAVIVGGTIAGVGGMFLALPCLAMLKIIFDHVPSMKPYSILIGDK